MFQSLSLSRESEPDELLLGDSAIPVDVERLEELPRSEKRIKLGTVTFRIANLVFKFQL